MAEVKIMSPNHRLKCQCGETEDSKGHHCCHLVGKQGAQAAILAGKSSARCPQGGALILADGLCYSSSRPGLGIHFPGLGGCESPVPHLATGRLWSASRPLIGAPGSVCHSAGHGQHMPLVPGVAPLTLLHHLQQPLLDELLPALPAGHLLLQRCGQQHSGESGLHPRTGVGQDCLCTAGRAVPSCPTQQSARPQVLQWPKLSRFMGV